jgi:CRISPR-associated endonuclease/helicase Cas3
MSELWAHSANGAGIRHRLEDHLRGTAALARGFGEYLGAPDLAEYLALVHDVGKAECGWQQGLLVAEKTSRPVGLDHKYAGAWLACGAAEEFVLCVEGHHGGLSAGSDLKRRLLGASPDLREQWEATADMVAALVPEIRLGSPGSLLPPWLAAAQRADPTVIDMLIRLVFSAVVDADFLDTEAHFHGPVRSVASPAIGDLASLYEERRDAMLARGGRGTAAIASWRSEVYSQALEAAAGPRGIYRLAAPTGSGKTIAAGGFAVHHARVHGLRRVIVAVPFISITEQNADVYRGLLDGSGQSVVLEHHSSADLDGKGGPGAWWQKLASENWDAPFIVTTTAQLFQSLFDRRPAAMRKLHRLAGSVIVLDEVQALPDRLLLPVLSALRALTEQFGATVLLASATQPAYSNLNPLRGFETRDVIKEPELLYKRFRRVRYEWRMDPVPTLDDMAEEIAQERQALAIVNTTADSAALHRLVQQRLVSSVSECLHLSTRMAAGHRHAVLARIRELLEADEPVIVVATQLIEAGVDVDFPVVYRAWAPADSLQQAAGRANRNGRLHMGKVVVFNPSDAGQPNDASYKAALSVTGTYFGHDKKDPDHLEALDRYYQERYGLQNLNSSGDGFNVENFRKRLEFPQVTENFQLIKEHTVPVAVNYPGGDSAKFDEITEALRNGGPRAAGEARQLLRGLCPFLATIPKTVARKAVAKGYAVPLIGDLLEWHAPLYDSDRGIDLTELPELSAKEVLVWLAGLRASGSGACRRQKPLLGVTETEKRYRIKAGGGPRGVDPSLRPECRQRSLRFLAIRLSPFRDLLQSAERSTSAGGR